ncbi:hypothetical protein [Leptolyngbya sp. NIES-2104]|uniref:hypothetical protein n=1 Tax=Leptolyngbya sp. NIES-2104 TaxID=1552121 RepID=UPI0006EC4A2E|nr:hypothetical protein [Leptolyngbya sp. NIES-2104]GAP99603.1 DNA primase [Leptolyngbya sp. NIES-2104]
MSRSFRSLKGDCPICQGDRKDCRENTASQIIHCRDLNATPVGFRFLGEDAIGFSMWIADSQSSTPIDLIPHRIEPSQPRQTLSVEERDRQFRRICRSTGYPATRHRQSLIDRGLTSNQIEWAHDQGLLWSWAAHAQIPGVTADLPGVTPRGYLRGYRGFAIAVPDINGKILGAQIKPDNGKYFWVSSETIEGAGIHLPTGEVPIGVYRPQETIQTTEINLAEGFLKPLIASQRFGLLMIGATGGQWARSPQLLRQFLDQAAVELKTQKVVLNADAGAVQNRDVLREYRETWNLIQSWGYSVQVRWWKQITKAACDIDELDFTAFSTAQLISIEAFEAIAAQQENLLVQELRHLLRRLSRKPNPARGFQRTPIPQPSMIVEYDSCDRQQVWQRAIDQGYQYILDQSGTGSGKSYTAGQLTPETFGVRQLFYVSNDHRNPTTETLQSENGWIDLEARHGGLISKPQPDGSERLQRASPGTAYTIAPNCNRTQLINVLRSKNVHGADTAALICGTCPLKESCTHAQGTGYGFLNQRRTALASPKVRSHPDSLAPAIDYDYSNILLIWDEPGQSFRVSQKIQVTISDVEALLGHLLKNYSQLLAVLSPILIALLELFSSKSHRKFGLKHEEVISQLPRLPELDPITLGQVLQPTLGFLNTTAEYGVDLQDLPRNLRKQFLESDRTKAEQAQQHILKQWFEEFLLILQDKTPGGCFSFHRQTLTMTLPDLRHRSIVTTAKATLFLDATLTPNELARKLNCSVEKIFVCCEKAKISNNLKLFHISDLGRMGMQRGKQQERRLNALINHYRSIDPTTKVIDFKKFAADGAHWRDSRGVNTFLETKTLIIVGAPCPNLTEMLAEYSVLTGKVAVETSPEFQTWLHQIIQAELIQEIGRLRSQRRPTEQLQVILITDFPIDLTVEPLKASEVTLEAATGTERLTIAIKQAIEYLQSTDQQPTQAAIAQQVGVSQSYISRQFRELLQTLLDPIDRTHHTDSTDDEAPLDLLVPVVEQALAESRTPVQVLVTLHEVFLDWLQDENWAIAWQQLAPLVQIKALSALLLMLPSEELSFTIASG